MVLVLGYGWVVFLDIVLISYFDIFSFSLVSATSLMQMIWLIHKIRRLGLLSVMADRVSVSSLFLMVLLSPCCLAGIFLLVGSAFQVVMGYFNNPLVL